MENNKIPVEFTKKQFLALMKAVYLGNWMANAQREDNLKEDYEEIEDYIFSLAPKFGFGEYMDHEPSDGGKYYPTRKFEEGTDVDFLHDEYDDDNFWDEICDRFGERDFEKKYTKKEIKEMSVHERMDKLYECINKWGEEFNDHGIDRLEIKE